MTPQEQHNQDRQFMIECLTTDLIQMLMEDRGLPMEEAMSVLYNSNTYAKLEDENTGLYYQSAVYVMEYLNEELDKQ